MTQDEVIALAREAGFIDSNAHSSVIVRHSNGSWVSITDLLERLVELVERRTMLRLAMTSRVTLSPDAEAQMLKLLREMRDAGTPLHGSLVPGEPPHRPGPMA